MQFNFAHRGGISSRFVGCLLGVILLTFSAPSRAQLWGFVDGAGVAHLASRQLDSRFAPVLGSNDARRVPGKANTISSVLVWLDIAPEVKAVQPLLREAASRTGVDAELLKAVIAVESKYQANAISPRGAIGLMQITADAAARYSSLAENRRLLDPRVNVMTGARMLADLIKRFGRIDAALAAWNAGEGAVRRAGGQVPDIDETQAHVQLVLELYWALLQRSLPAQARHLKIETQ